ARHSTDKQCSSAQDQIDRCREFCRQAGYQVVDVFRDEAISGAHIYNRPGISALISASVEQRFDRVISEDLSRISRDQADTANFFKKMMFLDISIQTVAEGVINELHIGLKSTMNALYLKDLADKTRRGMIAAVLKGSVPGGRTYGYELLRSYDAHGELVRGARRINENEARIVRQIFSDYAAGMPLSNICSALNRLAIPSPKGGKWVPSTLVGVAARKTGLLRQTLYNGTVTFNRMSYRKHPETGKRLSIIRPENEWLRVPVPELTIVDDELFNTVQQMLDHRSSRKRELMLLNKARTPQEQAEYRAKLNRECRARQSNRPGARHYLFSGRLYCGRHMEKIVRIGSRSYSCKNKHCFNRNVSFDTIMAPTLLGASQLSAHHIEEWLASPEVAEKRAIHEESIDDLKSKIESERQLLRDILAGLGSLQQGEEVRGILDDKELQIRRLRQDLEKQKAALAELTQPRSIDEIISRYFKKLTSLEERPADLDAHRKIRPFIQRIELNGKWDEHSQHWNRVAKVNFNFAQLLTLQK
uniref:recombinase family protein n=1 Tax=Maricaulis sp. TaxID=1486257 RepID=UPI0026190067